MRGYWGSLYRQWSCVAALAGLTCAWFGIFDYPRPLVFLAGGIGIVCLIVARVGRVKEREEHFT